MSTETIFQLALITATFLASLVAGLLFIFATVIMPGIKKLDDREFIRAFQVMDGVIQNNQPLFILVWVGSVIAMVSALLLGFGQLMGVGRVLLVFSALAYLLGVQLPTVAINVPLNNKLQTVNADAMHATMHQSARQEFEPRWNRWNVIRAVIASLASIQLIVLLLIL